MTIAFKSPVTSANVNAKLISRTDNQDASGNINFVNGLKVDSIQLSKASAVLDVGGTDGIKLPDGTTAQRPSAGNGVIRYNTTDNVFEGYANGSWTNLTDAGSASRSYREANTTDSITTADDTVVYSGASFTATLPTAVGNSGKQFTIYHNGTSISQVYSLATTGGQTIGGVASGSYKLCTNGEVLIVESDNVNYKIIEHRTDTALTSAGTMSFSNTSAYTFTITSATVVAGDVYSNNSQTFIVSTSGTVTSMPTAGTGAPAASGTLTKVSGTGPSSLTFSAVSTASQSVLGTTTTNAVTWYRRGRFAYINYQLVTSGAGTAGSGEYVVYLPTGMEADSSIPVLVGNIGTILWNVTGSLPSLLQHTGMQLIVSNRLSFTPGMYYLYTRNSFRGTAADVAGAANWGSGFAQITSSGFQMNVTLIVPIVDWQP